MGLDTVELIMRFEDEFDISISDADASQLGSPEMLLEYLAMRMGAPPGGHCRTLRVFHRLRRALLAVRPDLPRDIPLDSPLGKIADKDDWPDLWTAVRLADGDNSWPTTLPWPSWWRDGLRTLRHLVLELAVSDVPHPGGGGEPWTREELSLRVRDIIRDQTATRLDFDKRKSFRDLGID